ncbi:MAG TPA: nitroreductase family protein [Chloroflexota bacterium]
MAAAVADLIQFFRRLRTVRDFTPEPIPEAALADILEVGRWSGSASNRQPVEIVVVRDPVARQTLTEGGANTAAKAALALVIVTPGDPARLELEAFDDGRLSERLLLAAAAHGLGSGVTTLKGEGPDAAKKMLGIPAERRVRTVIAIGYPDRAAIQAKPKNPQPRKPIVEFAHMDHY